MQGEVTVLVDSREQAPLIIESYPVQVVGLPVGDYGIAGFSDWDNPQFVCERKSLNDLVGSLTSGRKRFWRELHKLRQFRFSAILIEGQRADVEQQTYRSNATPQSILASLDAISVRFGVHIVWCVDAVGAARQFESLVRQFVRGRMKDVERLGIRPGRSVESGSVCR